LFGGSHFITSRRPKGRRYLLDAQPVWKIFGRHLNLEDSMEYSPRLRNFEETAEAFYRFTALGLATRWLKLVIP
jgi:hypothetical protein